MVASYRFGIEEEYFLADATTRGTPRPRAAAAFHEAAHAHLPQAERELLQSQVEVATPPSTSFDEARATLAELRAGLAEIGRAHGVLVFAAGTHPVARWSRQRTTEAARYEGITRELRMVGRRSVMCGMHVHVEVPRPEARIDIMTRLLPFLPLLLALSTSSPLWQGRETGLAGYRFTVFSDMPRAGLPELFAGPEDYDRYVAAMVAAGSIKDASFLWWALRPSMHYPTVELRILDGCTRLDDAIAIAALYRCLVRRVDRDPALNQGLTGGARALVAENLWRAQRDGVRAALIGVGTSPEVQPFAACLDAALALVADDAAALGCEREVEATRRIVAEGTSADRQIAVLTAARDQGMEAGQALGAVVDWLAATTAGG
jgi:glutamate---cysteine ligase / carboxylate-amine ligase